MVKISPSAVFLAGSIALSGVNSSETQAGVNQSTAQEINTVKNNVSSLTGGNQCQMPSLKSIIDRFTKPYVVEYGDTLAGIARRHKIPLEDLRILKSLTDGDDTKQRRRSDNIFTGTEIRVPINAYASSHIHTYVSEIKKIRNDEKLNALFHTGDIEALQAELNEITPALYPKKAIPLGMQQLTEGILENMKYNFYPDYPAMVDKDNHYQVNCADLVKKMILFSTAETPQTRKLSFKKAVHAWRLFEELKNIGYTRKPEDNFMNFFDMNKIGSADIIKTGREAEYLREIKDFSRRLKINGDPGTMIAIYFRPSSFKHRMKQDNSKVPKEQRHYNTHQVMYIGEGEKIIQADNIGVFNGKNRTPMTEPVDSINYILNFVQERGRYESMRTPQKRKIIKTNLKNFSEGIHVEINGKRVHILSELKKPKDKRIQVQPSDTVRIVGSVVGDGFHDKNSDNPYNSENNMLMTRFLDLEILSGGDYIISEAMTPPKSMRYYTPRIGNTSEKIYVRGYFGLQEGDILSTGIKEGILRDVMKKQLTYSDGELELYKSIEDKKRKSRKDPTIIEQQIERAQLKRDRIDAIIDALSPDEKSIFKREYALQLTALKLLGYTQEKMTNPGQVKVNAPIPVIDTTQTDIHSINARYIRDRKKELQKEFLSGCASKRDFLAVSFFELDTPGQIYERIIAELERQKERFPSFGKLRDFNELQRIKFFREAIDKRTGNNINLRKGIVPSSGNVIIGLTEIDGIVNKIANESHLPEVPVSQLDEKIIESLTSNENDSRSLRYSIVKESYIQGFPARKVSKQLAEEFELGVNKSVGDAQLRFSNLLDPDRALRVWPTLSDIEQAIQAVENNPTITSINRRRSWSVLYSNNIEQDDAVISEIKALLHNYTPENRVETGKKLKALLTDELMRFDNGGGDNTKGKSIGLELLKRKNKTHTEHLVGWVNRMGIGVDTVLDSADLQERFSKTGLVVGHRGERASLLITADNFMLRLMQALGQDIHFVPEEKKKIIENVEFISGYTGDVFGAMSLFKQELLDYTRDGWHDDYEKSFPIVQKNILGQINYGVKTLTAHTDIYLQKLKTLQSSSHGSEKKDIEIISTALQELKDSNFSATSIYAFCNNAEIKSFLQKKGQDVYCFPTLGEFSDKGNRDIWFDYAKTPQGMEPPKVTDTSVKIVKAAKKLNTYSPETLTLGASLVFGGIIFPTASAIGGFLSWVFFLGRRPGRRLLDKTLDILGLEKLKKKIIERRERNSLKRASKDVAEIGNVLGEGISFVTKKVKKIANSINERSKQRKEKREEIETTTGEIKDLWIKKYKIFLDGNQVQKLVKKERKMEQKYGQEAKNPEDFLLIVLDSRNATEFLEDSERERIGQFKREREQAKRRYRQEKRKNFGNKFGRQEKEAPEKKPKGKTSKYPLGRVLRKRSEGSEPPKGNQVVEKNEEGNGNADQLIAKILANASQEVQKAKKETKATTEEGLKKRKPQKTSKEAKAKKVKTEKNENARPKTETSQTRAA